MSDFPVGGFNFSVEIDGREISFQEVSGISAEYDVVEVIDGVNNSLMRKLPSRLKLPPVILKKGICKIESMGSLFRTLVNQDYNLYDHVTNFMKNIMITLKDEKGGNVMTFELIDAFPIKINFGKLNAQENSVAIEELTYVYKKLVINYAD